jgi:hypothetical protein
MLYGRDWCVCSRRYVHSTATVVLLSHAGIQERCLGRDGLRSGTDLNDTAWLTDATNVGLLLSIHLILRCAVSVEAVVAHGNIPYNQH